MAEPLQQPALLGAEPVKSPSRSATPLKGTSSQRQYQSGRSPQQRPARIVQPNTTTMPLGESRLKPPTSPMSAPRVAPPVRVQTEPSKPASAMATISPVQRQRTAVLPPTSPRPLLRASFKVGPTLDSLVTVRRSDSGSVVGGSGGSVVGGSVVGGPRSRPKTSASKVLATSPLGARPGSNGSSAPFNTGSQLTVRVPSHGGTPGSKLGSSPPLPTTSPVYFAPRASPNPEARMPSPAPQKFFALGANPAASTVGARPTGARPTGVLKHSASFESTSVPKPTSGNKNMAIAFTMSWDAAGEVTARCLLDPGASVALLSKTFVKEHSVPKIKRNIHITVYDLEKRVVPDAGGAYTQPLVLRHQDHFTKETFEIAALDERIDAVLPLEWIEKHELVGLRSGQVYFGSTFCMQNCTKNRLALPKDSSAASTAEKPLSSKFKKSTPVPVKSSIPSPKSPAPGKARAITGTKITAPSKPTAPQKPATILTKPPPKSPLPGKAGFSKLVIPSVAKTTTAERKILTPRKSSATIKPTNKPMDTQLAKPTGPARKLISPNSLKISTIKNTPKMDLHKARDAPVPATEIPDLIHDEDGYDSTASSEFEENPGVPLTPNGHSDKSHQNESPDVDHAHESPSGVIGSEVRGVEVVGEIQ